LDEQDANEDDYSVAIFTAIENDELSKALLWVNK
jgi:predicted P-loop ATPase